MIGSLVRAVERALCASGWHIYTIHAQMAVCRRCGLLRDLG